MQLMKIPPKKIRKGTKSCLFHGESRFTSGEQKRNKWADKNTFFRRVI